MMSLMMHMITLILMMMIGWVSDNYMENDNVTDDDDATDNDDEENSIDGDIDEDDASQRKNTIERKYQCLR